MCFRLDMGVGRRGVAGGLLEMARCWRAQRSAAEIAWCKRRLVKVLVRNQAISCDLGAVRAGCGVSAGGGKAARLGWGWDRSVFTNWLDAVDIQRSNLSPGFL